VRANAKKSKGNKEHLEVAAFNKAPYVEGHFYKLKLAVWVNLTILTKQVRDSTVNNTSPNEQCTVPWE
jgi:hypothetical protein